MLPYFAAFDHSNYTRWGVIFLTDMKILPQTAPEVQQAFESGDFVRKETASTFNQIPDDQALEHVKKIWKDSWTLCLNYKERLGSRSLVSYLQLARQGVRRHQRDV